MALINRIIFYETAKIIPFQMLSRLDQKQILDMRNDPSVRMMMTESEVIADHSHFAFCDELTHRSDCQYFAVVDKGIIGVVYFTEIDMENYSSEVGLYKNPGLSTKKLGRFLMETIYKISKELGLRNLHLKVKSTNVPAFCLYKKESFSEEYRDSDYIYMTKGLSYDE